MNETEIKQEIVRRYAEGADLDAVLAYMISLSELINIESTDLCVGATVVETKSLFVVDLGLIGQL